MFKKKPRQIERICGNCKLYDGPNQQCSVVVLLEGKRVKVPMEPKDACLYESEYFDPSSKEAGDFSEDIKEVKFWVENQDGQKTAGNGTVKMEYPEGFLGEKEGFSVLDDPEYLRIVRETNQEIDEVLDLMKD